MYKRDSVVVLFLGLCLSTLAATALPCETSKSSFIDAISNDSINLVRVDDYEIGEERSINIPVGPGTLGRSAGQVLFTGPGSGTQTKTVTIEITTSSFLSTELILQFAVGPMTDGFASCANRDFLTTVVTNSAENPKTFKASSLDKNNGDSSYIIGTRTGVDGQGSQSFGVEIELKTIPGQVYEATCGAIKEKGGLVDNFECNISVEQGTSDGSDDDNNDDETPVQVNEADVKIQPETMNGSCPLSSIEHLNFAIKTEQALKLRLDRQATDIENAINAVTDAGINPGPALRRLDALIEFIRDDINDSRNVVKGGLEFSKRHLVCAKQKLVEEQLTSADKAAAKSEIEQAIINDDEAITAIMTENFNLKEESVRLKATLENTASRVGLALNDKEQAGDSIDPSFEMPNFEEEDVNDIYDEFRVEVSNLADKLITKLDNQKSIIKGNNTSAAVNAILDVQNTDCINQFFDEVVQEYTRVHTTVTEELKKVADAAKEAAESDEPDPDAPTTREGKIASNIVKQVDKSYEQTIVKVNKTKKRFISTYGDGKVGTSSQRTNKKIQALLKLLKKAEIANDKQWKRMIRKALKKVGGFGERGV